MTEPEARRFTWWVTALMLFLCAACARDWHLPATAKLPRPAWKYVLNYRNDDQPHRLVAMLPGKTLEAIAGPADAPPLPKMIAESALLAKWPTPLAPQRFLWVAVDRATNNERFARLFIDADGDGRLDDVTPVAARYSRPPYTVFEPVEVIFQDDRTSVPYHLQFTLIEESGAARFEARSCGWYEATIEVGGEEKTCVLIDQNANGVFNDRSIDFAGCDLIRIVTPGLEDVALVGELVEVDGQLYRLEVEKTGGQVGLMPAHDVQFGKVRLEKEMTELVAGGENGMFTVKLKNGRGQLPVGRYRIYQWSLEREDKLGNIWQLTAHSFGNPEIIEVKKGATARISPGEPIVSAIEVFRSGEAITIRHEWRGRASERIQVTYNGAPPPPASVHIQNTDGTYDRIFTFDHG